MSYPTTQQLWPHLDEGLWEEDDRALTWRQVNLSISVFLESLLILYKFLIIQLKLIWNFL